MTSGKVTEVNRPRRKTKNSIKDIDSAASEVLSNQLSKKQQELVENKFKAFIESDVDTMLGDDAKYKDAYEVKKDYFIFRMFYWRPNEEDIKKEGDFDFEDFYKKYTSVGKVLVAGEESGFKEGDLVKLRDYDCLSIRNPKYEQWQKAQLNESNMEKVGEAPPQVLSNIHRSIGEDLFVFNPIKESLTEEDYMTFMKHSAVVQVKIKDYEVFTSI